MPSDTPDGPDQPLRWERDSAEEAAEAHRQRELDKLAAWQRGQRHKRLTDTMEAHGLIHEDREGHARYIVPCWWPAVEAPATCCPRCQVPAAGDYLCDGCRDAQHDSPDPDSLLAHWEALSPLGRRLHLSAAHGIDPWTGRPCRIEVETTTTDEEAGVGVSSARLYPLVPHTSWNARREVPG